MPTVSRTANVPYSALQMYDLVNAIAQYPEFLPWCPRSEVHHQSSEHIEATVYFAKGPLQHSFTTRNTLHHGKRIEMHLIKGPFKTLVGDWTFESLPQGCKITFNLSFEWQNALVSMLAGPVFEHLASTLVDAFTQRAHSIYTAEKVC